MNHQIPLFSRFGGGPNGPNIGKQMLIIFAAWLAAKICIRPPGGGNGNSQGSLNPTKYRKPILLSH